MELHVHSCNFSDFVFIKKSLLKILVIVATFWHHFGHLPNNFGFYLVIRAVVGCFGVFFVQLGSICVISVYYLGGIVYLVGICLIFVLLGGICVWVVWLLLVRLQCSESIPLF